MTNTDDFLIGGDELFNEPRFVTHYEFMLEEYRPVANKPIALFLSCSKYKPYNKSPYRRVFNAMIEKKMKLKKYCHIYTVSEPAIIIPEELDDTAVTRYDFPPDKMQTKGRKIFVQRLVKLLPKILTAHKINFYILPKHHRGIFEDALKIVQTKTDIPTKRVIYAPPLTYNLPKARKIIEDTLESEEFAGIIPR